MAAEAMAREELAHVATLRKERRGAYHCEHKARVQGRSQSRARELREEAELMSARAAGFGSFPPALLQATDAQAIAEALTDAYLDGAERSDDPARLELLQMLAERAIARLAWLRSLEPAVEPKAR
jgi:hypothetical protein